MRIPVACTDEICANLCDPCEPFNAKVNLRANRGGRKVKIQHKGSLSYDLGK